MTVVEQRLKLLQEKKASLPSRIFQFAEKDSLSQQEILRILDILYHSDASKVLDIHDKKKEIQETTHQIKTARFNDQLHDGSKITLNYIVTYFLSDNKSVSEQDSESVKEKIKTDCKSFKNNIQNIINAIYDPSHTDHECVINRFGNSENAKDNFVNFFIEEFFTTRKCKLQEIDSIKGIVSQIDNVEGIPSIENFIVTIKSCNKRPSKSPEARRPTAAEIWLGPEY